MSASQEFGTGPTAACQGRPMTQMVKTAARLAAQDDPLVVIDGGAGA